MNVHQASRIFCSWIAAWVIVGGTLSVLYAVNDLSWQMGAAWGWLGWLALTAHGLVEMAWAAWGRREIRTPDDALLEWPDMLQPTNPGIEPLMSDQYLEDVINDVEPIALFTQPSGRHALPD